MSEDRNIFRTPALYDLDTITNKLRTVFTGMPVEKVILFGSHARKQADAWSDLDLLVIAFTRRPFIERFKDFNELFGIFPETELLVYTPKEFTSMLERGNPFIDTIQKEGVEIYCAEERRS